MPIDLKISQLTDGTIIQVTDEIPVSRAGVNRRVQVGALAALDSLSKADVGLGNVVNADTTTTSNITDSLNKRFVTDADLITISDALVTSDISVTVQGYDANTTKNNVAQQFTKQHSFAATVLTDAATISWNLDDNQDASVTLAGNRTLGAPTNMKNGGKYSLLVKQDASGGRTLNYNFATYRFENKTKPVLSTDPFAIDKLNFVSDGTLMTVSIEKNFGIDDSAVTTANPEFWIDGDSLQHSNLTPTLWVNKGSAGATLDLNILAGSPTYSATGLNGFPALDLTGFNFGMRRIGVPGSAISGTKATTIFIVQKVTGVTAQQQWSYGWNSTAGAGTKDIAIATPNAIPTSTSAYFQYGFVSTPATDAVNAPSTNILTDAKVFTFVRRAAPDTAAIFDNGVSIVDGANSGSITLTDTGTLGVGPTAFSGNFSGLIAEVLQFARTLSPAEITAVNEYLMDKYNIV